MRAIAPNTIPALPAKANSWARSTKRADSVFHAHTLGFPVCGSRLVLDRHYSKSADSLGSFQYHGVCPRCYKMSLEAVEA